MHTQGEVFTLKYDPIDFFFHMKIPSLITAPYISVVKLNFKFL
jgi:hypothetical protein